MSDLDRAVPGLLIGVVKGDRFTASGSRCRRTSASPDIPREWHAWASGRASASVEEFDAAENRFRARSSYAVREIALTYGPEQAYKSRSVNATETMIDPATPIPFEKKTNIAI
jgi:hypothetical protein